ncbi:MAG: hypothetical protein K0S32_1652 [Bacteroidetes bacterium]|jgi:hypothetical protein|nr:hypothetical protein [Bacteroidota bacterium]
MKKFSLILILLISGFISWSQTFEVEQIEQLFRPRLRFDSKYIFDSKFNDTSSVFRQGEANAVFTFPIKTRVDTDIKLDLSSLKLKDILRNSVRIKASQVMGVFRVNVKQTHIGFDSLPNKNIVNVTGGILGVRLTRKYRIMFYSANASFAEQDITANAPGARASALLGQLHLRGLKKNFFYGVAATYSDGLFLPAAFFGGSQPIGRKFIFNYTLPVQLNLQYRDDRRTLITLGVTADGYRTGINYKTKRVNLNYTSASAYLNLRYKFTNTLVARVEGGYIFYQNLKYTPMDGYRTNFSIAPGPYVQAGFSVLFGQTLWEKIANEIFKN